VGLFLILFPAIVTMAQCRLTGQVNRQDDGAAMPRAHVQLVNTFRATVTDARGVFSLGGLKSGTYTLRISHIGYGTLERSLRLSKDTQIVLSLAPQALMAGEYVVTATRMGASDPGSYTQLNREDIRTMNHGQDLPYLLALTPGAVVSSDAGAGIGYTGIRIRGTDITRINVTLNGIPLNDPESQGLFWVNMPDLGSSLESVQVQRGVGTAANGPAAFGASINMSTLDLKQQAYADLLLGAGSFNTQRRTLSLGTGLLGDKLSVDGRFSRITSDGYIDRSASDLGSIFLSGGYFGKRTVLRINYMSGKERTGQAWDGVPSVILDTNRTYNGIGRYTTADGKTAYYDNETDNYRQDHYQLLLTREIMKSLNFSATAYYIHGEGYYEQYKEDEELVHYDMRPVSLNDTLIHTTDLIRQKWLDNDLIGLNWSINYQAKRTALVAGGSWNDYAGDHYGEVLWARYMGDAEKGHRWYFNEGHKNETSLYTRLSQELTPRLSMNTELQFRGIRYRIDGIHDDLSDLSQSKTYAFMNPRAGMYYRLSDGKSLYATVAVSHREPTRSDLRDADEGHSPQPERLIDLSGGYHMAGRRGMVEATLYHMAYKDQLVLTGEINDVGAPIFTNVARSFRQGVEMSAGYKPGQRWSLEGTLALSRNQIVDFTAWVDDWESGQQVESPLGRTDLAFSPRSVASGKVSFAPKPGLTMNLISKYVGKQFIDNTSSPKRVLEAYLVNDLCIEYILHPKLFKELGVNLLISNILNAEYETNAWVYRYYYSDGEGQRMEGVYDGYFPQAGRNFMLSLRLSI